MKKQIWLTRGALQLKSYPTRHAFLENSIFYIYLVCRSWDYWSGCPLIFRQGRYWGVRQISPRMRGLRKNWKIQVVLLYRITPLPHMNRPLYYYWAWKAVSGPYPIEDVDVKTRSSLWFNLQAHTGKWLVHVLFSFIYFLYVIYSVRHFFSCSLPVY